MMTEYSKSWTEYDYIVLDLEGTGAQHKDQEGIVELSAIRIKSGEITNEYFYRLIDPEIDIPPLISKIHGLKNADVESEPTFREISDDLLTFINGQILIGHNVQVDYRLLKKKIPEYEPNFVLDTYKLVKNRVKGLKSYGLDNLINHFHIEGQLKDLPIKRGRHSAYYDALATAHLFEKFLRQQNEELSLADLIKICGLKDQDDQMTLF